MKKNNEPTIYRGEIYYADLSPAFGSEQGGIRPVVIVQNNTGNKHAPTTIVAPITSQIGKKPLPTHILFNGCGMPKDSVILLEQIRTIDKGRLRQRMGQLPPEKIEVLDSAIKISLGLA
jgi:mRNA interferase MazF